MSTEVVVALIAACGIVMAGGVGATTAYLTARHQARTQTREAEAEFLADRDKLLWEQAGKFWDERAGALTNQVELERTARETDTASLKADMALLKQDNAELRRQNLECEKNLRSFQERLRKAGEVLVAEVQAAAATAVEEQIAAQTEGGNDGN